MPIPRCNNNIVNLCILWLPAKLLPGASAVGDKRRRIAWSWRGIDEGNLSAGHLFGGMDHLQYGKPAPIAEIKSMGAIIVL